ncbi:Tim44/TimA family putative adaptor protein (plasmid) [Mesorhizobium sp. B2-1-8]|uniref:Tim44/TimA family putative adaptor protein n=1 Tax=Mesorhizobium sp. B2-1-8 TaxID=2589967 RepID=UPI00112A6DB7|nr:Tim44/TimA family putative adaptor protein [Mesorhizobium sp. B2-1-8]UCI22713.1 Tim44/TimA family putative adaptor protein [Mesorhizobium sp. B2-1-8]
MNETTDPSNHILIVAIIAFYWALLGSWSQLLPRSGEDKPKRDDALTGQRTASTEPRSSADAPSDLIRKIDPDFDLAKFLAGAKTAYETILRAYVDSDFQTLKHLVGPEVLYTFEQAIAGRRDCGEMLQLTFIGTSEAKVVDALEKDGTAEIVVRYVSDLIQVTRLADDTIVAGDPKQIVEVTDTWTFACETLSTKRNWMLIATEGE